ncbi:VIR protein [Plasmodium vivax]|uniref:VIR protein n=1 Tax=Plasmodium vivax TaxID=5855 RepID=A0A1G4E8K1_PLAVI|nr:VIR protein [Plasmodium vivax]
MEDSNEDYDTFEQYNYNKSVYEQVRGNIRDELVLFPHEILTEETENNYNITKDCAKLSKYLKNFHSREGCKTQNCCQYINYKLNETVRRDYDSKESIFDIYIRYMRHSNNNNEVINLCLPEIKYMDNDKYNKIHKLYNAYYTCNFYISNKNDRRSCRLANSCANTYNNIMTVYIKQDDTKFCKTIKKLKVFLEEYVPPLTSNCNPKFSISFSYPHDCTKLLQKSEEMTASMEPSKMGLELTGALGPSEQQTQGTPELGSPGIRTHEVREFAEGVSVGGTDKEETTTFFQTQSGGNDISTEPPSAKTSNPAGTIIGTSLGFVLPLITIYRFTPLGNWVNTKVLGRDKLKENMKKNEREFLLNNAQTQDINSGDTRYHIKYNSVLNE